MYRIGEFSRFALVSTRTLRLYDEMGLLKPAVQDRYTAYRYYSAHQLARLNRILVLKDMGLTLEQIKKLLDAEVITPDQIKGMLRLKQVELHRQIEEEQAQLERIESWLKQIDRSGLSLDYQINLKQLEPVRVASITTVADLTKLPALFAELVEYVGQHKGQPAGAPLALFYDEEYKETDLRVETALPISGPLSESERVKVRELPAVELTASTVHIGPLETLSSAFWALSAWIEANNYIVNGPNREIFLNVGSDEDGREALTEIQFPVVRSETKN